MSDLYNLKVSVDGLTETLKQLNEFNTQVSKMGSDTQGLKHFQTTLNTTLRSFDNTASHMTQAANRMNVSAQTMMQSMANQGQAIDKAMKGATNSAQALVSNKLKNFDWSQYLTSVRKIKSGFEASNSEVNQLIKQTSRLQALRNDMLKNPAVKQAVASRFGSNAADYLERDDLSAHKAALKHRQVQLAVESTRKSQQQLANLEAKSNQLLAQKELTYSRLVGSLSKNLEQNRDTAKSLDNQLVKLKLIESEYQRISSLAAGQNKNSEVKAFTKLNGATAFTAAASAQRQSLIQQGDVELTRRMNAELINTSKHSERIRGIWRGIAAATGNLWLAWGNFAGMAAGLAVGSAAFKSMTFGRELGWQMELVGVAAETGKEQVESLKASILELGSSNALYGPVEMASALRVLTQAGLKTKEALEMLPTTLNLSLVAEVDTERSALFLAGLRSSFNLDNDPTGEAVRIAADQTAKAAAESQTSIEQMMESMKQASSEANKFNLSVSDTSTALALLARVNITGSAAGTAVKNLLTDLAGRTEHSRKALEALGISAYNSAGMVKPFSELIKELQVRFQGMTDQQKQGWMRSFLNERGMRAANVILNTSVEEYERLNASVSRAGENMGYTSLQSERLAQTAEGTFRSMKSAWQTHFANVGTETEGQFKSLMATLTSLANMPELKTSTKALTSVFIGAGQAATLAATAVVKFSGVLIPTAAFLGVSSVVALAKFTAATWAANTATGVLGRSILALKSTALALASNPLGIALGGIAAAGAAAWIYFDKLNPKISTAKELMQGIAETAGAVSTEVYEAFNKGLGRNIDDKLGIGIDVDKYNARVQESQRINNEFVLETAYSANQFQDNLTKINSVLREEIAKTLKSSKESVRDSTTYEVEQRTMLLDRYKSLLTEQLTKFDQHHSDVKNLSAESAMVRQNHEIALDGVIRDMMAARTELAIKQMRDTAAEAIRQQSVMSNFFSNVTREFTSETSGAEGALEQRILSAMTSGKTEYLTDRQKKAVMLGVQRGDISTRGAQAAIAEAGLTFNLEGLRSLYRSSTSTGSAQMWKDEFDKDPQRFRTAAQKSLDETRAALELRGFMNEPDVKWLKTLETLLSSRVELAEQEEARRANQQRQRAAVAVNFDAANNPPRKEDSASTRAKRVSSYSGVGAQRLQLTTAENQAKELESTYKREREFYGRASDATRDAYVEALRKVESLKASLESTNYQKQTDDAKRALADKNMPAADKARAKEDLAALQASRPQTSSFTDAGFKFTVKYDHVKYGLGRRSVSEGAIDCSGFVAQLYEATVNDLNKNLGSQVFNPNDLKGKVSADQIKKFAANTVMEGNLRNLNAANFKPGMLIGTDNGQKSWEGKGRYKGIDHIVMVVQGPNGEMYTSQSSSGKGVNQMPLQQYLSTAPNGQAVVVDPLAAGRSKLGGKFSSYAGLPVQTSELEKVDAVLAESKLDSMQQSFRLREQEIATMRHTISIQETLGNLDKWQVAEKKLKLEISELQLQTDQKVAELNRERGDGNAESLRVLEETKIKVSELNAEFEASKQAETDWRVGLRTSYQSIVDESTNYAKSAASAFDSMTGTMITTMENLATTGKLNFREMTSSILKDLARIAMRMAMLKLIQATATFASNTYSDMSNNLVSGSTAAANASTDGIGTMASMNGWTTAQAKGGVWGASGRITAYARGGVVNSPTYFGHAGGAGLMGENGPEAIVPLSRMPNGDLGIQMSGMGGGTVVSSPVTVHVTINSDGSGSSDVEGQDIGRMLGENIKASVKETITMELLPGGLLYDRR